MSPFKDIKNTGAITSLPLAQAGDAVVPKHGMTACNVCDLIIYN